MPTATPHPPYRLFETRVARTERVSPAFVRVTLVGPTLHLFAPWGLDQRIKLVLPRPDGAGDGWAGPLAGDVDGLAPDDWRHRVAGMPPAERHPLRTYTPRAVRPETGEVDVDLLVHELAGPASAWALAARPGDRLLVSGPDVRADDRRHGIQWRPAVPPTRVLLVGDEAAVPALAGIMLTLDADVQGVVLVEADAADACPPIDARPAGVEVRRIPGTARPWPTRWLAGRRSTGRGSPRGSPRRARPSRRCGPRSRRTGWIRGASWRRATGARPAGGRPRRRSSVRVASPTSLDAGAAVETSPLERRPP
ncbi:NADPH-dependent ferric-chelate reductase [Clavibacter michiganensis subsp. michiganensis]|nr:siderophore-interacting protein [Clavibacter michiganensis]OUE10651.1 NADPH-dependent ferric-chelate reductase [Clavibacter michiganensis subsp. michiganensis]